MGLNYLGGLLSKGNCGQGTRRPGASTLGEASGGRRVRQSVAEKYPQPIAGVLTALCSKARHSQCYSKKCGCECHLRIARLQKGAK